MANISVVAGHGCNRETVGTIQAREGILTNVGIIDRVTKAGTVVIEGKQFRRSTAERTLKVRHSEAFKHGYPFAEGSNRTKTRRIRRGSETIYA